MSILQTELAEQHNSKILPVKIKICFFSIVFNILLLCFFFLQELTFSREQKDLVTWCCIQGVAPQLYNWNSVGGSYLPPPSPSSHALPPPSPRDSACTWLANLPVHSLPWNFTWYTGYEGQRLRDEGLSICCIILGCIHQRWAALFFGGCAFARMLSLDRNDFKFASALSAIPL